MVTADEIRGSLAIRHLHLTEVIAIDTQGRRWYARALGGLAIFSTLPEGWYYIQATHPTTGAPAETYGWQHVGGQNGGSRGHVIYGLGQYVEVTAPLLTANPVGGALFNREYIDSMRLLTNGRTLQTFLSLVPGLVFTDSVGTLAQFTAAGQRRYANRLTVDGIDADLNVDVRGPGIGEAGSGALPAFATSGGTQTLVPLDAIEEIQVQTTNASSGQQRTPGAQTVIVTRTGGDRFSGSGFVEHRPSSLAASDWFTNASGGPKRLVNASTVGASLGGPVIPHRVFTFGAWEQQAIDRPFTSTVPVPSASLRESASPSLQPLLDAYPKPNGRDRGDGRADFTYAFPASSDLWTASLRVDANLFAGHRLFVRLNRGRSSGDALGDVRQQPTFLFTTTETTSTTTATTGLTSVFSSSTNDLRFNSTAHRGSQVAGRAPYGDAQGLPIDLLVPDGTKSDAWTRVNLFPGVGGFLVSGRTGASAQSQTQIADTWTWLRGRHEWQFGGEYRQVTAETSPAADRYTYSFDGLSAALLGRVRFVTHDHLSPSRARITSWAVYAQDTFRVSPRLSITSGARYSVQPAPYSLTPLQPLLFRFDSLPEFVAQGNTSTLWNTSWTNFAPRMAATYQLGSTHSHEMTLQTGWSLVYDELTAPGAGAIGGGYPYIWTTVTRPGTFPVDPALLTTALPADFAATLSGQAYAFPRNLRRPRTYQWHVGIEQALGPTQHVGIAYVGARGRDLIYDYTEYLDPDHPVQASTNAGSSDYHAALVEFVRHMTGGVEARLAYTWGHTIDLDSGESVGPNPPPSIVPPRQNCASADFDRRHVLWLVASYRVPSLRVLPTILRPMLASTQISVVGVVTSGAPVSVDTAIPFDNGTYELRPDLIPGMPLWLDDPKGPTGQRINLNAFRQQTDLRQGTIGRNTLRGDSLRQLDLSLSRSVRVNARIEAELRVDAFNLFNVANFGPPRGSLISSAFGRPTQTYAEALGTGTLSGGGLVPIQQVGGPRSIQLGVRLRW